VGRAGAGGRRARASRSTCRAATGSTLDRRRDRGRRRRSTRRAARTASRSGCARRADRHLPRGHVAAGWATRPARASAERRCGARRRRARTARLADGTVVRCTRGEWARPCPARSRSGAGLMRGEAPRGGAPAHIIARA
jgi:hypothetical protein